MKVFISSTYKDLIDYRAAAIRAVEGTNFQASKMEVFGARPNEPLDACLKEVEESDLFIGIYALRYGFIPENSDISITEMEYLHAKKLGKSIYCFMLDEDNQPWLSKWIEGEPGKSKLQDFKKRIQRGHVCDYFLNPDDLRARVANALSHYVAISVPKSKPVVASSQPIFKPKGSTLPHQPYFFGRDKELATIADAISPESRTWGVLIDGPGGIGKTSLAIRAAHVASTTHFERKIFITAKTRELTPTGEKPLTDFTRPNYLQILSELAMELGEDSIQQSPPEQRANMLRLALTGRKTLIVLDNLETLDENERTRLYQFLALLPEGNKAIVTSRRRDRDSVAAHPIRLDRMRLEESLQLLSELAKNNLTLNKAKPDERIQLYEVTNGNPLLITWICSQLGNKDSNLDTIAHASKFIEKAPEGNDPLEYIFGDLLDTFTNSETKVLAALTYFSVPVRMKWIIEMTGLPKQAAQTALEDLANRSILIANEENTDFFLPPLAAQFIKTRRPKAVAQTGDKLTDRAYALIKQYGGVDNYKGFKILGSEWLAIVAALPSLHMRKNNQLQSICDSLVTFLEFSGKWDESLELTQQAEQKALAVQDYEHAGWRAYDTSWIYYLRGQSAQVLECANRIEKYWKNSGANQRATVHRLRGLSYELENNYREAKKAYLQAIKIWKSKPSYQGDVGTAYVDLGFVELTLRNSPAAIEYLTLALEIGHKNKDDDLTASALSMLATVAERQKKWKKAQSLARESLSLAERIGRQRLIAQNCHIIANSMFVQNKFVDGMPYILRAVEIYSQLNNPNLQKAQTTLDEFRKKTREIEQQNSQSIG
jgi:tetratricopeptide (TPR) repeat protein